MRANYLVAADGPHSTIRQQLDITRSGHGVIIKWEATAVTADKFRQGRTFLVGDAAHEMPPYGGYGVNTASTTPTTSRGNSPRCWMDRQAVMLGIAELKY